MIKLRNSRKKSLENFKKYGFPIEVYYYIKKNPGRNLPMALIVSARNLASFIDNNYYFYSKYNYEYPFNALHSSLFWNNTRSIVNEKFSLLEEIMKNLKIDLEKDILEYYEEITL